MLYDITVPQFTKMLHNLTLILDKAESFSTEKKIDVSVLLNDRLAPNMFNLIRQVQIALHVCQAKKLRLMMIQKRRWPN